MRSFAVLVPVVFAMSCHTTAGVFVTDLRFVTTGLWVENCRMDIDTNPGESSEERVASRHDCTSKVARVGASYVAAGDVPTPSMAVPARIAAEAHHFTSGVFVRDVFVDGAMIVVTKCRVAAGADTVLIGPCGHERAAIPTFGPPGVPPGLTSARPVTPHTVDWDGSAPVVIALDAVRLLRPVLDHSGGDRVLQRLENRYGKATFVRNLGIEGSMLIVTRCEISVNQYDLVLGACDRQSVPIARRIDQAD